MGGWGGGRKERLIFRCEKAGRPPPPHGVVVWGRSAVRPCSGPAEISCPNLKSAADRRHQRGRTAWPRQSVRTGGRTEGPFLPRGPSLDGVPPHLGLPVAPPGSCSCARGETSLGPHAWGEPWAQHRAPACGVGAASSRSCRPGRVGQQGPGCVLAVPEGAGPPAGHPSPAGALAPAVSQSSQAWCLPWAHVLASDPAP